MERQIIELLQITSKIKFGLFGSLEHNSKMRGTDLINQDFNPGPCPLPHTSRHFTDCDLALTGRLIRMPM